ncbi:hypothetical protein AOC36_08080 [Erysipelothrix larvae]|uniref:Microcystin degradation protein MlrC n=1 Tax=Erysipelothrix larvae TaxID=1514105 RepID=A0A109UHA5_9FIRM|nr:M81 family metallopeptidase [Erysipelothrix larvae]AMC93945.1 hypothetical protein AOC36_08080 [Erysipelothrix larvae]
MKVLVAHVSAECNEHISHTVGLDEFLLLRGDECIDALYVREVFEEAGIEIIPSQFASLPPNGMVKKEAYVEIADRIINDINTHMGTFDGIYLHLHGASGVVGLEEISGEHYIIKRIRNAVGKYLPIAVSMDPHGNLSEDFTKYTNIVRCYRESPHIDHIETKKLVAEKLVDLMKNRRPMTPIIKKLPIMVGGERSVSAKEPMRSINQLMDQFEEDSRVFSICYNVGYIRHDDDKLGAAVIVVPNTEKDHEYCDFVAQQVSQYAWDHRHEFKFSGNYDEPDASVQMAINFDGKTAVITDSGDNCGAGGAGHNTVVLRELLKADLKDKHVLVAGIHDKAVHSALEGTLEGQPVSFDLGNGETPESQPVSIKGTLVKIGEGMYGGNGKHVVGPTYTVNVEGTNLDVLIMNRNIQYGQMSQFHKAGLEFHDYEIVVVKMGYLDTDLIPETAYHVMALTDGPTIQRSERIPFKRIHRPMWPMDDVEELIYIK